MESKPENFGSYEWIHSEIQRRVSALTQSNSAVYYGEDPYVVVSREVFEELLKKFSEAARAHAA